MSIAATIRKAKTLDLNGAQPGASAAVNRVVKTLEDEHQLRMNLQRENNRVRRVATELELEATIFAENGDATMSNVLNHYAKAIRKALSPEGTSNA